eukprot:CAMPEP_0181041258 /NCGR_PEP_ID=MMETSP1070-20121207/11503_1 /TAXON_ID=265543 /ORGANISM="Minutocellus polymorphus, Strain NH13" /LENGTH=472 /DNA_ID=CAMNT_0023119357 /DNA_START=62 /DNA_END=1480 /DNA_ORIENTATION=-
MADLAGRVEALLLQERSYTSRDYLSQSHRAAPSASDGLFPSSSAQSQVHMSSAEDYTTVPISSVSPSASSADLSQDASAVVDLSSSSSSTSSAVGRKRRSIEISPRPNWTSTTPPQAFAPSAAQLVTGPATTEAHEIPPSPIQTARTTRTAAVSRSSSMSSSSSLSSSSSSSSRQQQRSVSPSGVDQFDLHSSVLGGGGHSLVVPTLQDWRAQIAEWFFKVADSLSMSREIVAVAVSYLDRYLGTLDDPAAALSRRQFQLVCLTCLYVATKLYDHKILPPVSIVNLSRGCFTARDIEDMERTILDALQWRLSPPTPLTFAKHLLLLLPRTSVSRPVRRTVSDVAKYLTELAVIDYAFVGRKASSVGLAAVLTAMDVATYEFELSAEERRAFERAVSEMTALDCRRGEVADCRLRLRGTYRQGGVYSPCSTAPASSPSSAPSIPNNTEAPSKKKRRFHTSEIFVAPPRGAAVY